MSDLSLDPTSRSSQHGSRLGPVEKRPRKLGKRAPDLFAQLSLAEKKREKLVAQILKETEEALGLSLSSSLRKKKAA